MQEEEVRPNTAGEAP
jgi:hypothetical protein